MSELILTEDQSVELITKLSTDDDFRAALVSDPAAAMLELFDITLDSRQIPESVELPSKTEIENSFEAYVANVNASLGCLRRFRFETTDQSS